MTTATFPLASLTLMQESSEELYNPKKKGKSVSPAAWPGRCCSEERLGDRLPARCLTLSGARMAPRLVLGEGAGAGPGGGGQGRGERTLHPWELSWLWAEFARTHGGARSLVGCRGAHCVPQGSSFSPPSPRPVPRGADGHVCRLNGTAGDALLVSCCSFLFAGFFFFF